jgi:eukaryotic-like serine/threonine-protein kinase
MSRIVAACLYLFFVAQTMAPGSPAIQAASGTFFFGLTPQFAVSPDGQSVVFVAHAQRQPPSLWVRGVGAGEPRQIAGTEQASYPFWSHDGRSIGFFSSGKLKTVPAGGGSVLTVCDAPTGRGGTWNERGVIVFASGLSDPLRKVPATGGTPEPASVIDAGVENSHRWPQFMPDGQHLLFWAGGGKAPPQLKIAAIDSPTSVVVGPSESNGAYGAGHVFFKRGNVLMARAVDPKTFAPTGEPSMVAEPISADAGSFFASFAVSPKGTLLFTRGAARPALLTWLDRKGASPGTVGAPGQYTNVTMSPDGKRLAVSLTAGSPANRDVWIVDLPGGGMTRLTTDPGVDATPVWSPGSNEVIFSSTRSGIYQMYRRAADGSGADTLLVKDDRPTIATDWSRDGTRVLYTRTAAGSTGLDVWVHFVGGGGQSFPLIETKGTDDGAVFSPDGRWAAYQSNESGRDEIYLQLAPSVPPRAEPIAGTRFPLTPALDSRQVSRNGGTQPRWRHDGRELFYLSPEGALMAAEVPNADPSLVGEPRQVLPPSMTLVIRHSYTTSIDGQRILMPVLDQSTPSVISVGQWR